MSQQQPQPDQPIPGQMDLEEVIELSEQEDGSRLSERDHPTPATIHELAQRAVRRKLTDKEQPK